MNKKKDILWRVYFSFLLIALLAIAIVFKIGRLQTVDRAELKQMADSLSTSFISIEPIRGNIYAADGSLMATSIPIYEARWDTRVPSLTADVFGAHIDSLAWYMSNYFRDKPAAQYKKDLTAARKRGERYYLLKRRLTHTQVKEMQDFPIFRLGRYKSGFITEQKSRRILPFQQLGQRTIGYIREDVRPVGLEGCYNKYLSGTRGMRLMQRVSGGNWVPINDENELDPKDGLDVITTIDINFQDIAETALSRALQNNKAHHGCAIVMETATGKIKAIANLTRDGEGDYIEKYNYAIGESTEPGSTFKLASVLALLETGSATPETIIDVEGGKTEFFGQVMRDSKLGHDKLTLEESFELSSNVGISKAVYKAFSREPSKFVGFIKGLKLDQPLGVPIAGEGRPVIYSPRDRQWSGTTLPWMSIGYEMRMTALQTLTLYNAVANNGIMVKPRFVNEIREVGKVVQKYPTEIIHPKIASDATLQAVIKMMKGVVEKGTATNLKNDLYSIAGKTGTALIAQQEGGYRKEKIYQASFVGFFPANKPAYSCIVVINNPSEGSYYGSAVAAPVFKEISDKIFARTASTHNYLASFESRPDHDLPLATTIRTDELGKLLSLYPDKKAVQAGDDDTRWVTSKPQGRNVATGAVKLSDEKVPDVKGMVLADAIYILENMGLKVHSQGHGRIRAQSLMAGAAIKRGDIITLQLN